MPAKRKSAFSRALEEAQSETVSPQDRDTVSPSHSASSLETATLQHSNTVNERDTVTPQHGKTVSQYEKVTFYLTPEQIEKLEDLAHEHRKQTHKRINRNEIVRMLIDRCTTSDLDH